MCYNLLKFADDTKVFSVVRNDKGINKLQDDLVNLSKWSQDWLMLLKVDKCKVMHVGQNSNTVNYEMNGKYLVKLTDGRDLKLLYKMT